MKYSTQIFNQLSSLCKLQVSNLWLGTFNSISSAATTRALNTRNFFKGSVNWISLVLIPKQHKTFAMKWIQKKEKVLVGSKSMRCEAQIARFWLRSHSFPELTRAFPNPQALGSRMTVTCSICARAMSELWCNKVYSFSPLLHVHSHVQLVWEISNCHLGTYLQ